MEKKGIIWRRGSTDRQEIQSQDAELTKLALSEGFKEENLIHLGEAGASAIKQNDLYVQEVEKLISTLENDKSVRYCFVWEVSRLARSETAFYALKEYFIKNKIQLVCKTPSIRLFDEGEEWNLNKGAEVTLALLLILAKQEMEIKKERFARAKARNKAEGRFNGGSIKIGYRLDADKHFAEDDEKADIVRKIFLWYVEDKMSLRKIQDRLADMGIYSPMKNFFTNGRRVGYILRDKAYIGENGYPRIVDDELFNKAQKRLSDRHKDKDTSNVYYCKGIIRDVLTGAALIARKDTKCYMLRHREHRMTVNLNAMDFIAAFSAELLLARRSMDEAQENRHEYGLKIGQNETLIASKKAQIEDFKAAIERAIVMNINQPVYFPTEKMNSVISQNDSLISRLEKEISDLEAENVRMREFLEGKNLLLGSLKGLSDERRKELIDSVIKTVWVEEVEKNHFHVRIENNIGFIDTTFFDYKSRGRRIDLSLNYQDGRVLDLREKMIGSTRY